ncbi:Tigger transposable element-derived protein 4-like 3 [Homarus americanus]|uniref:Tigger transposable element-derived protein 4-like 3 n=1 Tax=Homarus americanus TaxID=6706 RepID=A0A8J5JNW6_HOMAM|nr:Tigger transposable element-derived protein 4-like 3 [Homarus americanus]
MPKCTCTIPSSSEKKKRKTFNIGDKVKILNEFEQGASASVVARRYGVNESTIRGIRQKADKIHAAFAEPTVSKTTQHLRPPLYQEMEDTLKIWIENMQRRKVAISGPMIKNEAMEIQTRLLQRDGKPLAEMTKEHEEEEEAEDVPPHVKKEWKITQLKEYMTFIYAAIKCIRDNDPDLGRATENVDSLYRLSSTYSRLLDRKIANQKQRSTTSYFRCSS